MTERSSWVVTTSGSIAVSDVARDLTEHGFAVEQVLDAIGVITGQCAESKVAALRKRPGVGDIARDSPIDVGPPDSPDVW